MSTTRINGRHITAIVSAVCVAIILAPVVAQAGGPASRTTKVKGTVKISNFPATQNVAGTVNVGNLPAVQHVDGTVNVGNQPVTQHVDGTVNVSNLPATQPVSGTVTTSAGLPGTPFTGQDSVGGNSASVSFPAGHHLVVQTIGVEVGVSTGTQFNCLFDYATNGTSAYMFIPVTKAFSNAGEDIFVGNLPVEIYADPTNVAFSCQTYSGSVAFVNLTVSGYLTP